MYPVIILLIIIVIIFITIRYKIYFVVLKESFRNPKFFNELKGHPHLDARYGTLKEYLDHSDLVYTLKFFTKYCKEKDIKPVIMHGSLIGLYFNNDMLPWDDDIDIILSGNCITNLTNYENLNFLIEINPNSLDRSKKDKNNIIDARVINKNSGVFIDITFFYEYFSNGRRKLRAKDNHIYNYNDIYPLKKSKLCGSDVFIPSNVEKCLIQEYGQDVLLPKYKNWKFINRKWIKIKKE